MNTALWIIIGIMSAVVIVGVIIIIKDTIEIIHLRRARCGLYQFHAKTEQMIYDYCMKNNFTRDQFFDRMSKSLEQ